MKHSALLLALGVGLVAFAFYNRQRNKAVAVAPLSNQRSTGGYMATVGARHNNPLNIKFNTANDWVGQDKTKSDIFAHFDDKKYGYRAAFKIIDAYVNKHGLKLISDIIYRFAPPSDNNPTENYIKYVAAQSGIPTFKFITRNDYKKLVAAMAKFESGDDDAGALNNGFNLAFGE
jgi:hypothetical protein